jgi:hypothetical protein
MTKLVRKEGALLQPGSARKIVAEHVGKSNNTLGKITRTPAQTLPGCQEKQDW